MFGLRPTLLAAAAIFCGVVAATSANANTITIIPLPGIGGNENSVEVDFSLDVVALVSGPAISSTTATGFEFPDPPAFPGSEAGAAALLSSLAGGTFAPVGSNIDFADIPGVVGPSTDATFSTDAQFFALKSTTWIAFFKNVTGGLVTVEYDATENEGAGLSHFLSLSSASPGLFQVEPVPVPAAVWLFGSGLVGLVALGRRRKRVQQTA